MVEVKQLRVVLYERCGGTARQELGMPQDVLQEEDVGLHPTDLELVQSTLHLLDCVDVAVGPHYDLQMTKFSNSGSKFKRSHCGRRRSSTAG